MTFDEMREAHPQLRFAVYAFEPGDEVTLEVVHEDKIFSFVAPTAQAAIDLAFPPEPVAPAPTPNVFD